MNLLHNVFFLLAFLSISTSALCNDQEINQKKNLTDAGTQNIKIPKTEWVENQIKRIEEKLETEPKAEGWMLVGDANMHLKKYEAAIKAYQEAYVLSDYSDEAEKKLKRALHLKVQGTRSLIIPAEPIKGTSENHFQDVP